MAMGSNKDQNATIQFRKATVEDYEDVLNIDRGIYDGFDYLPVVYHDYCRDPNRTLIVALLNGKIAAFAALYMVSEGRVLASQATRVSLEARNSSLIFALLDHFLPRNRPSPLNAYTINILPPFKFIQDLGRSRLLLQRPEWKMQMKLGSSSFHLMAPSTKSHVQTRIVTTHEARDILNDYGVGLRLFPHGWLVCAWQSIPIETSNLDPILQFHAKVTVATFDVSKKDVCISLSIGNYYSVLRGFLYTMDYYGDDESLVIDHLQHHMRMCWRAYTDGQLWIQVQVPEQMNIGLVESLLKEATSQMTSEFKRSATCYVMYSDRPGQKAKL